MEVEESREYKKVRTGLAKKNVAAVCVCVCVCVCDIEHAALHLQNSVHKFVSNFTASNPPPPPPFPISHPQKQSPNLAEFLHLHNLLLGLEETPPGYHSEDHIVDDATHCPQFVVPLLLQQTLQVLTVKHLSDSSTGLKG